VPCPFERLVQASPREMKIAALCTLVLYSAVAMQRTRLPLDRNESIHNEPIQGNDASYERNAICSLDEIKCSNICCPPPVGDPEYQRPQNFDAEYNNQFPSDQIVNTNDKLIVTAYVNADCDVDTMFQAKDALKKDIGTTHFGAEEDKETMSKYDIQPVVLSLNNEERRALKCVAECKPESEVTSFDESDEKDGKETDKTASKVGIKLSIELEFPEEKLETYQSLANLLTKKPERVFRNEFWKNQQITLKDVELDTRSTTGALNHEHLKIRKNNKGKNAKESKGWGGPTMAQAGMAAAGVAALGGAAALATGAVDLPDGVVDGAKAAASAVSGVAGDAGEAMASAVSGVAGGAGEAMAKTAKGAGKLLKGFGFMETSSHLRASLQGDQQWLWDECICDEQQMKRLKACRMC